MKADGTVTIDSRLDASGIKAGAQEIMGMLKRASARLSKSQEKMAKQQEQLAKAVFSKEGPAAGGQEAVQRYQAIQSEVEKLESQLANLNKEQKLFTELGGSTNDSMYQQHIREIERMEQKLAELKAQQEEMSGASNTGSAGDTSGVVQQEESLQGVNQRLGASFAGLKAKIAEYVSSLHGAEAQTMSMRERLIGMMGTVKRATKALFRLAQQAAQLVGRGIIGGLKKLSTGIFGVHKSSNKAGRSIGSMVKRALVIGTLYKAIRAFTNGAKEGFQNLAQYSDTVNKSLSKVMSSLTRLKNSFATAFAPLVNVVAPVLSRFIDLLSKAATSIGMLMAALTGQKTFTKAIAVQQDYAASLENSASSAKDAEKATEGYLSPLDEINKLEKKDTSKDSGSGVSPKDMFKDVEVEPLQFDSWGEAFNSLLDYLLNNGVPALRKALSSMADTLNTFSQNLYEAFTFPGVKEKVQQLGQEVAQALNDFVSWIDWKSIGGSLGAGLNLALQFMVNLIYTFNWLAFGGSIATAVNQAIAEIDWNSAGKLLWAKFKIIFETLAGFLENLDMAQVAKALSDMVIGLFDSITETIQNIDWYKLGKQVETLLVNIDWIGVAKSVCQAIGAAFGALAMFLWGLIEDAWNKVVDWWKDTAYEDGQFTIKGLLQGIKDVLADIGNWLKENVFKPIVDGFKSVFQIHSPSKVFEELGTYLMQGLFNGISSLVERCTNIFSELKQRIVQKFNEIRADAVAFGQNVRESVVSAFQNLKTSVINIWEAMKNGIRTPINAMIGFINSMIDGVVDGINAVIGALNKINVKVPKWVPKYGGKEFGFDIGKVSAPHIPYLATGAVIPPNAPFMAMLGDQRNGNNLEMPENLLRRIIREESGQKSGGSYRFVGQINRRVLFDEFISEAKMRQAATGINPLELA